MKTIIFCGGKGERLKEYESKMPKSLWIISGKPLIWYVMNTYALQGYTEFVLCTGYKHEEFVSYFEQHPEKGWDIIFDNQGEDCETAKRLQSAMKYVDTDHFFCNYADGLSSVKISELLASHISSGKIATLTAVKPVLPYGILEINVDNCVTEFREKPIIDHWVNGGFFVFSKDIERYLHEGGMLENRPFSKLSAEGQLHAFKHEGEWLCMDTYKDYTSLVKLMEEDKPGWLKQ